MQQPEVSIVITAFNHEKTICRAIDSVLAQKTDFPIEIIVSDDGSTDKTRYILLGRYLDIMDDGKIILFLNEHDGMIENYHFAFSQCHGKYIAVCDGDDYWIDDTKTQQQYDYMEQHPGCALCVTRVYTQSGKIRLSWSGGNIDDINDNFTYDNLLKGCAGIFAQSFFIRKSELDKIQLFKFKKFNVWDYPLVLELIRHNYFWCLDFYSAVYVKNEESVTNTRKRGRRLKYILGTYQIRLYFIVKYGCKFSTFMYLIYRFLRDIYAIVFNRWFK